MRFACSGAVPSEQKHRPHRGEGRARMTDIDPQADIELHPADEHVTVRVPLAGLVTAEWLRCYQQLALAAQLPVHERAHRAGLRCHPQGRHGGRGRSQQRA